jgi:hypothetical protein
MPVTIDKPSLYFDTKLYTGNGSTQSITGLNFKPDLLWIKERSGTGASTAYHVWFDGVRGVTKAIYSNDTSAEVTGTALTSFNSDGFTLSLDTSQGRTNDNADSYVAWNWLGANTTVSNTQGTITSTVSANTTSGFSIVSYTGDGVNNRTVGHGLGATPKFIIIKNRSAGTAYWSVINPRSTSTTNTNIMYLNRADAEADDTNIMGTNLPNSTTFGIGNYAGVNVNGENFIAYCFAPIKGYSSLGSYVGNGNDNGTFVYTGFKPAYLMIKNADLGAGYGFWTIWDNKRNTYNPDINYLIANTADAESTGDPGGVDFLSNGFKLRNSYDYSNKSSTNYIYMCFAENPIVSSKGIPTTAR